MRGSPWKIVVASFTLMGAIIGVGLFGVPYVTTRIGLPAAAAMFVGIGAIQLLQHLMYAEVAIAAPERLRLVGLARKFLGARSAFIAAAAQMLGYWGAQVAYIIVGGKFLHLLLAPFFGGAEFAYQMAWAAAGAIVVLYGLSVVSGVDFIATALMLGVLGLVFALGAPQWSFVRASAPMAGGIRDLALAYGVILFATSGLPAVLELEEIVDGDRRRYRRAVALGSIIATVIIASFALFAVGVVGTGMTEAAVDGLGASLGPAATVLLAVFGFFAVATSYLPVALNLRTTLEVDFRLPPLASWLFAVVAPVAFFVVTGAGFIGVIGFIGAVLIGVVGTIISAMYLRVARRHLVKREPLIVPEPVVYAMMVIFILGAAWGIARSLLGS